MKHASKQIIAAVILISICSVFLGTVFSQEKMEITAEDFSGGLILQFDGQQLAAAGDLLTISDSLGHELALLKITLDGEKRWARVSRETADIDNVVHWYYDKIAGQLVVDLRGLKNTISSQSNLELSVSVLNTRAKQFKLSAYNAVKQADNQAGGLSKIKDINVDVK